MKRKNLIFFISIIILIFIFDFIPRYSYASDELNININIKDKEEIEIGKEIHIIVSWNKGMQAADYILNYDPKKVEYVKSDIDEVFINDDKKGKIKTSWASFDDIDKTSIEYTFKIKRKGEIKFTTEIAEGGFATRELKVPNKYNEGELVIKLPENNFLFYLILVAVVIPILIILILKLKGGKQKK